MAVQNNYDRIIYTSSTVTGGSLGGFTYGATSDPLREGYIVWQEPTSNNSGRAYLRKKDEQEGVDYLYDRVVTTEPVMQRNPFTGQMEQVMTQPLFGMGESRPKMQTTVKYNRVKLAPGQSPEGYRQEEAPKRYNATEEQGGQARSYATRRSSAGARGTILTGRQGTNLGTGGGKTVLGG